MGTAWADRRQTGSLQCERMTGQRRHQAGYHLATVDPLSHQGPLLRGVRSSLPPLQMAVAPQNLRRRHVRLSECHLGLAMSSPMTRMT